MDARAAALMLVTPFYQTNDDVALRLLAEGHYVPGDAPRPFLLIVNSLAGELLAAAYRVAPSIPWYDLLMGATLVAGACALLAACVRTRRDLPGAILIAVFFLLPAFVRVQYSVVAMTCAAGGLALALREEASRGARVGGALLFVWASLIRFPAVLLIAAEAIVLAHGVRRRRAAWLAAVLGVSAALWIGDVAVHRDFHEFNFHRTRLAENVPEALTPAVARQVGWSENDAALLRHWFFADPQVYSLERLRRADRLVHAYAGGDVRGAVAAVVALRWAFVFLLALASARPRWRYSLAAIAFVALLMVVLGIATKPAPERITWPMLILLAAMLMLRGGPPRPRGLAIAATVVAAAIAARSVVQLWQWTEVHRVNAAIAQRDADALARTGQLVLLHGAAFPYEDVWQPLHSRRPPFRFVPIGVGAQAPPVRDFLRRNNMTDLPWALCTQPGLLLVTDAYTPPLLATFVREHHRARVQFEPAVRTESFIAWRCRPAS